MKITKLIVKNFKSFDELIFSKKAPYQALKNVNILVGANASGKSNFLEIFEFLKEIQKNGIEKTISEIYGGISNVKNFNSIKKRIAIKIELSSNEKKKIANLDKTNAIYRLRTKISYEIAIMQKPANNFDFEEKISFHEKYIIYDKEQNSTKNLSSEHTYGIENKYGKFKLFSDESKVEKYTITDYEDIELDISSPYPLAFIENLNSRYKHRSVLEYDGVFIPSDMFNFGIFDFEPQKAKGTKQKLNTTILAKNGENLTLIIENILKDEDDAEQFVADVAAMLSFVEEIKVHKFENSVDLRIKEKDNKIDTKSNLLSYGTISIISIIVALYYQKHDIIFIEEPENGIHPSLIADLIAMVYDVAEYFNKQIFITTHSPEILRTNGKKRIGNLLMVDKKDGFSKIEFAGTDKHKLAKVFLEKGLGVDTLFIQNLLDN